MNKIANVMESYANRKIELPPLPKSDIVDNMMGAISDQVRHLMSITNRNEGVTVMMRMLDIHGQLRNLHVRINKIYIVE